MDDRKNQYPQIRPVGGDISTESLPKKEPAELAEELERLLDSMTEESYDPSVIDAYLAALEEKAPAPPMKEPGGAYEELQERIGDLATPETRTPPQLPARGRPRHIAWKRYALVAAAAACLTLTMMIGAQAAGLDVFGNLARWTSDTFSFILSGGQQAEPQYLTEFKDTLAKCDIPAELAPTWVPEGFETDGPQVNQSNPFCTSVYMRFTHEDGRKFSINIDRYASPEQLSFGAFEKDMDGVETYTKNGMTFYILSNVNTVSASWADGVFVEYIDGILSVDEVKQIIDSMGGRDK